MFCAIKQRKRKRLSISCLERDLLCEVAAGSSQAASPGCSRGLCSDARQRGPSPASSMRRSEAESARRARRQSSRKDLLLETDLAGCRELMLEVQTLVPARVRTPSFASPLGVSWSASGSHSQA
eukprot:2185817-Rhodomonas_salina.1